MKEIVVSVLRIVAPLSVAFVVFAQGLSITPNLVAAYFRRRPWRMLRALAAVLVLVPAAALAIILVLKPAMSTGVGLAILVACPPAPLMLKSAKMGGASQPFMASLHLCLAALAFVSVPAVLYVLSLPLGFHADVDLAAMTGILARTIVVPICLGLAVHGLFPRSAERLGLVFAKIGMAGLIVVVLFAIAALYPTLLKMDPWSYVVITVVSVAALAVGHLLGPQDPEEKTTLAVECGVRHPALAIAIGVANFSREKALPVLVPCVLTFVVVATIYLTWRGKGAPRGKPRDTTASAHVGA